MTLRIEALLVLALTLGCADDVAVVTGGQTGTTAADATAATTGPVPTTGAAPTTDVASTTGVEPMTTGGEEACGEPGYPSLDLHPLTPFSSASTALAGDLDVDADLDLVTVHDGGVTLWRNDAGGALAPEELFATYRIDLAVADLDGDGDPDMVLGHAGNTMKSVVNDGTGDFSPKWTSMVLEAYGLVLGDIDGDARPDLFYATPEPTLRLNDGTGAFPDAIPLAVPGVQKFALADMDGDADLDVVAASYEGLQIGFNDGGTLAFPPAFDTPISDFFPWTTIAGDFDADGDSDVAVLLLFSGNLAIWDNDGTGLLTESTDAYGDGLVFVDFDFSILHALDLEGDGDLDLASPSRLGLSVFRRGVDGYAAEAYALWGLEDIAPGDFDGDGHVDLATTVQTGDAIGGVGVLLGGGQGTLPRRIFYAGESPETVVAGDLDGDGDDDLVVADSGPGGPQILVNDDGLLERQVSLASDENQTEGVAVADFDGDGRLDVATARENPEGAVFVYRNLGDLTFESMWSWTPAPDLAIFPESLAAGDLDGDGDIDFVTGGRTPAEAAFGTVAVLVNLGGGEFAPAALLSVARDPESVVLADIDGNGDLDIAATSETTPAISVLLGEPGLAFAEPVTYPVGGVPEALAAGDLDGDSKPELVAAIARTYPDDLPDHTLTILWNDGAGLYPTTTTTLVGEEPRAVVVADADADGDLDIAVADAGSHEVSLLVNDAATFVTTTTSSAVRRPMGLVFAEMTPSCGRELVVSGKASNAVIVLQR